MTATAIYPRAHRSKHKRAARMALKKRYCTNTPPENSTPS